MVVGKDHALSSFVLHAGKRGKAVESILAFADQELTASMRRVKIRLELRDEVRSRVLRQVWGSWIPEAKRRLLSGQWKRRAIVSKLRTALCFYATHKSQEAASREAAWQRRATGHGKRVAEYVHPEARLRFVESSEEEVFLNRLISAANGDLSTVSPDHAITLLRLVTITKRATTGIRRGGWTWLKIMREFSAALEE